MHPSPELDFTHLMVILNANGETKYSRQVFDQKAITDADLAPAFAAG